MGSERLSPCATPSATRDVLERHGLYTKYALGQNFLVNDDVVRKIADLADLRESDHVLEVGPGIGTLTSALLKRAGRVTSIEMDHDLPAVLRDTLAPWLGRFTLLEMDALDLTREHLEKVAAARDAARDSARDAARAAARDVARDAARDAAPPLPNKMVSNLPYAVAATVVLEYLQRFDFLESATVMVQKEVADRMMAKPGSKTYGAYTVKLGLYASSTGRFPVAPGNFFPPPRVDSAVLRLERATACADDGRALAPDELEAACTMADAAFANRRKTLANSCKTYFASRPDVQEQLLTIFNNTGIDPRRRGETLEQAEFIRLGLALRAANA